MVWPYPACCCGGPCRHTDCGDIEHLKVTIDGTGYTGCRCMAEGTHILDLTFPFSFEVFDDYDITCATWQKQCEIIMFAHTAITCGVSYSTNLDQWALWVTLQAGAGTWSSGIVWLTVFDEPIICSELDAVPLDYLSQFHAGPFTPPAQLCWWPEDVYCIVDSV